MTCTVGTGLNFFIFRKYKSKNVESEFPFLKKQFNSIKSKVMRIHTIIIYNIISFFFIFHILISSASYSPSFPSHFFLLVFTFYDTSQTSFFLFLPLLARILYFFKGFKKHKNNPKVWWKKKERQHHCFLAKRTQFHHSRHYMNYNK